MAWTGRLRGDLEQRSVAAESGAERAEPPMSAGGAVRECFVQYEQHTWAAHISQAAQDSGAARQIFLRKFQSVAKCIENFPPARMKNPRCDLVAIETRTIQHAVKECPDVPGRNLRYFPGENISKHSVRLLESQEIAISRLQQGIGGNPFHLAMVRGGFVRKNRCSGAIAKQAGANQNTGIVIEIKCGAADFDADRERLFAPARAEKAFCRSQIGNGRPAPLPHKIEGDDVVPQPEAFADVACKSRTEVTGARADDNGIDVVLGGMRCVQGAPGCLRANHRRMF